MLWWKSFWLKLRSRETNTNRRSNGWHLMMTMMRKVRTCRRSLRKIPGTSERQLRIWSWISEGSSHNSSTLNKNGCFQRVNTSRPILIIINYFNTEEQLPLVKYCRASRNCSPWKTTAPGWQHPLTTTNARIQGATTAVHKINDESMCQIKFLIKTLYVSLHPFLILKLKYILLRRTPATWSNEFTFNDS